MWEAHHYTGRGSVPDLRHTRYALLVTYFLCPPLEATYCPLTTPCPGTKLVGSDELELCRMRLHQAEAVFVSELG